MPAIRVKTKATPDMFPNVARALGLKPDPRLTWLRQARHLVGQLAEEAFSEDDPQVRNRLMHTMLADLADVDAPGSAVEDLWQHTHQTPYGYARYGGVLKHATLLTAPMLLDQLTGDKEALT